MDAASAGPSESGGQAGEGRLRDSAGLALAGALAGPRPLRAARQKPVLFLPLQPSSFSLYFSP